MAASDLTSLDAVKAYLQMDSGDTGIDPLLNRLITSESARFCILSGNPILQSTDVWTTDGNGTRFLLPRLAWPRYPLQSVQSLVIDGVTVPAIVNFGDHGYNILNGRIELVGYIFTAYYALSRFDGSTSGVANVTVSYTAGYATAPADVAQAVAEMVALKVRRAPSAGLSSQSIHGESVSYAPNPWAEVQSVIDAYTRPVI